MPPLAQVLAEAAMPLYAVRRDRWQGVAFVGTVARQGDPATVTRVQIVYLDEQPDLPAGVAVSLVDPRSHGDEDPIAAHLAPFAARFDGRFLPRGLRARAFELFPAAAFRVEPRAAMIAGGPPVGAEMYTHRETPLRLLRAALRRGEAVVDLGIAGWNVDVAGITALLEPVDLAFANAFDATAAG